jgi:hypothetical protein
VTGNWDGSSGRSLEIGVFRPSTQLWYLDNSVGTSTGTGNRRFDGCVSASNPNGDFCYGPFGQSTDIPVAGDWNGDGRTQIGTFRPTTGQWFLDANSNGQWDGCAVERCLGPFGTSTDRPVAGLWTGDGVAKIGFYRPSSPLHTIFQRPTALARARVCPARLISM